MEEFYNSFESRFLTECDKKVEPGDVGDLSYPLLCVTHPGFYGLKNNYFNYDRNKKSLAYVPYGKGQCYIQGCLLGGKPQTFLEMCENLSKNIHIDDEHGVVAEWHDESHVNRYIIDRNDVLVLGPGYAYPEFTPSERDYEPVLLLRDKEKYIEYKGKKKRSKYWLYYKLKKLDGFLHGLCLV